MVLLQSYVFVWSNSPDVFCRWSPFTVISLWGALDQKCSVDGPPSKLCFCVEHQTRVVLQMVPLHSYVFVRSIRPEVFCSWSSFKVMFLCGALDQGCSVEEFEDTKGIIRICKSKDRQHNGQSKNNKMINNDLQNITQKTKDRATQISLKTWGRIQVLRRVSSSCSTSGTCRVTLVTNPEISLE